MYTPALIRGTRDNTARGGAMTIEVIAGAKHLASEIDEGPPLLVAQTASTVEACHAVWILDKSTPTAMPRSVTSRRQKMDMLAGAIT